MTLPIDGIHCDTMEGAVEHIHVHLQIFDRGHVVEVPAGIGIPPGAGCLYWLHTHTADGIIHIESPVKKPFTLGQFFDIWVQPLSKTQAAGVTAPHGHTLAIWVDGKKWTGHDPRAIWVDGKKWTGHDPRAIVLHDKQEIVIQNGPPFGTPKRYDWSKL